MTPLLSSAAKEITEHNQRGIAWALSQAYAAAESQTDPVTNPAFETPLRTSVRGSIRWNHVQSYLKVACESRRIVGFEPVWSATGGKASTNQVLELMGSTCSITAVHVGEVDETPRDAAFRRDARGSNQMLLEGIDTSAEDAEGRVHLLLVHGGVEFDFAELRCYHGGEDNPAEHTVVVGGIERWRDSDGGGSVEGFDQEPVTPPVIELRPQKSEDAHGAGR